MKEFQPTPQGPDIRKVPPGPNMPGWVPPGREKVPGQDKPEIDDGEGDDEAEIIIPGITPGHEIGDYFPDLDERHDDKDLPPTKH